MFDLFFGVVIGFIISFFVLKRSINKTGCGSLKMCREHCPYFSAASNKVDSNE